MNQSDYKMILSLKNKKGRKKHNTFLIEGRRLIESALSKPSLIKVVYYTITFKKKNFSLFEKLKSLNVLYKEVPDKNLKKLSSTIHPSGIFALYLIPQIKDLILDENKWIYLDKISDPGNLGALLRSASWFNFKNIALSTGCVDPYNPKVVRSSMGGIFNLSIHLDIELKSFSKSYNIIGTSQNGDDLNTLVMPKRFVLIIGSESDGISEENFNIINQMIAIKKLGEGDSLNAGVAGSIVMYKLSS